MKNKDIYNFLISLARDLNKFYKLKLNKKFKAKNKGSDSNYDPVTIADKKFEKFIRNKISKKFPQHSIIGEEFGLKNKKSDYSWVIDPIDGTRSFVIGNPTWSNLIGLNYKGNPVVGLANFPKLNKYYLNISKNNAYVIEGGKKRKLSVNKKVTFKNIKVAGDVFELNELRMKQLWGNDQILKLLKKEIKPKKFLKELKKDVKIFKRKSKPYLLYN